MIGDQVTQLNLVLYNTMIKWPYQAKHSPSYRRASWKYILSMVVNLHYVFCKFCIYLLHYFISYLSTKEKQDIFQESRKHLLAIIHI